MKWSWSIARIGGIDLRVHATFVLLIAWLALARWQATGSLADTASGVAFALALFASVLLHELGHAAMARRHGVATRDITLLPIGGVARLESMPREPSGELWIALAGPAVSAALAVVLWALAGMMGLAVTGPAVVLGERRAFVVQLMWANVVLLAFNLLPAFPMDGGRVLRALLARRTSYLRATEIAARVGRSFALVLGAFGLLANPMLAVIALFVWLAAAGEMAAVQLRTTLGNVPVRRVMISDVRTLRPDETLGAATDDLLAGFQHDFPVVDDGRVVGLLTRDAMLAGVRRNGRGARVGDAMEPVAGTAEATEPLDQALSRLQASHRRTLPVVEDGRLRGVLTLDNVGEYMLIDAALRTAAHAEHDR